MKLKYQTLIELNHRLNVFFDKNFHRKKLFDFRLLVIIACLVRLSRFEDIAKHFGLWKIIRSFFQPNVKASIIFMPHRLNR